jgi:predicted protein tyrosine phosphatase
MSILVSPLSHLSALVRRRRPARVISVLDPGAAFPELGPPYAGRHLRLAFHDAHTPAPGVTVPSADDIARLLAFLAAGDARELLLVHCRAGIGRSTATAFVAACARHPHVPEHAIAAELRRVAPHARPNETVVALADAVLARGGRMAAAIAETGRGLPWIDLPEGQPFEFSSRLGARSEG